MKYGVIAFAVVAAIFCRIFLVSVYKMPSQSMAPLILSGDFVLASQVSYGLKLPAFNTHISNARPVHGSLVVYTRNAKTFVKRVLAVGGEEVEFVRGNLSLSGRKCDYTENGGALGDKLQSLTEKCGEQSRVIFMPVDRENHLQDITKTTLSADQYLVGGDNRSFENSPNSVEIINSDQIIGKPLLIWLSYSSTRDFISSETGVRWNRILTILK